MDFYTLTAVLFAAVSLLSVDAVVNSGSVAVEVTTAPQLAKMDKLSIDQQTLTLEFEDQLNKVAHTESIINPPEIRPETERSVGMALALAARVDGVAYALQTSLGYRPDRLRLALYVEDGELRGLVTGNGHGTGYIVGSFRQVLVPEKGESLLAFVRRCALWGAAQLAPYFTSLYLMEAHADDGHFAAAETAIQRGVEQLPNTPINSDRALFDNLLGIIALFKNDPAAAAEAFKHARLSDPANPVPVLNAAFVELQQGDPAKAAELMHRLIADAPPSNKVLLGTAYLTWAAALAGQDDLPGADRMLTLATQTNPDNDAAFALWAEVKRRQGENTAAEALWLRARAGATTFENYAEVALLYFRLPEPGKPIMRSQFVNPRQVNLR